MLQFILQFWCLGIRASNQQYKMNHARKSTLLIAIEEDVVHNMDLGAQLTNFLSQSRFCPFVTYKIRSLSSSHPDAILGVQLKRNNNYPAFMISITTAGVGLTLRSDAAIQVSINSTYAGTLSLLNDLYRQMFGMASTTLLDEIVHFEKQQISSETGRYDDKPSAMIPKFGVKTESGLDNKSDVKVYPTGLGISEFIIPPHTYTMTGGTPKYGINQWESTNTRF